MASLAKDHSIDGPDRFTEPVPGQFDMLWGRLAGITENDPHPCRDHWHRFLRCLLSEVTKVNAVEIATIDPRCCEGPIDLNRITTREIRLDLLPGDLLLFEIQKTRLRPARSTRSAPALTAESESHGELQSLQT